MLQPQAQASVAVPEAGRPWVLIALGANLGDPAANVLAAMDRLEALAGRPIRRSSLLRSEPVDCPPGSPPFINAAVAFPAPEGLTPETWLEHQQLLEKEFGRRPKAVLNEARPLDVDLIAWGQEQRFTPHLTLPHPRAHVRRFVLEPLAEIVPDFVLPGQTVSIARLLQQLP